MSARLDKSFTVVTSHQTPEANRCVDVFSRPDGPFGLEEFRRDPEDMGVWTPLSYFSGHQYRSEAEAVSAARRAVPGWTRCWAADPPRLTARHCLDPRRARVLTSLDRLQGVHPRSELEIAPNWRLLNYPGSPTRGSERMAQSRGPRQHPKDS